MRPVTRYPCLSLLTLVLAASAGSVAAPVPKTEGPAPRLATLKAALGKGHLSKEVRAVIRAVGDYPAFRPTQVAAAIFKDDGKEDEGFYLTWKTRGVEAAFEFNTLKGFFLYNQGSDEFGRYPGELPGGLVWGDDPAAVERKLGKPAKPYEAVGLRKVAGKLQDEMWMDYDDVKGLGVWVILRRIQGEPYAIHSIHLGEANKE